MEPLPTETDVKERLERLAQEVSPDGEAEVQVLFEQMRHNARLVSIIYPLTGLGVFGVFLGMVLALGSAKLPWPFNWGSLCFGLFPMLFVGIYLLLKASERAQENTATAVEALAQKNDVRQLGFLIDLLYKADAGSKGAREVARQSIVALLPKLSAGDGRLLTERQRSTLHGLVEDPIGEMQTRDPIRRRREYYRSKYIQNKKPITLALLKAYEQIGEEKDLPLVQRLANGEGVLGSDNEIWAAAKECLPLLIRTEQLVTTKTLLRASEQPATTSAELLRPVTTEQTTEPDQLLRSSSRQTP